MDSSNSTQRPTLIDDFEFDQRWRRSIYTLQLISGAMPSDGVCSMCSKQATCMCDRCGDLYCSLLCQRADWMRHRISCFPMPTLVDINTRLNNAPPTLKVATVNQNGMKEQQRPQQQQQQQQAAQQHNVAYNDKKRNSNSNSGDNNCSLRSGSSNYNSNRVSNLNNSNSSKSSSNGNKQQQRIQQEREPQATKQSESGSAHSISMESGQSVLHPKPNSSVLLVGFISTNHCMVRPNTKEATKGFLMVMDQVNAYARRAPPLTHLPNLYSKVLAPLDDKTYARAVVLAIRNSSSIRVRFVDLGSSLCCTLSHLRETSEEMERLPKYATKVALYNVPFFTLNDVLQTFMSTLIDTECRIKYMEAKDELNGDVELYNSETAKCLNEQIRQFCTQKNFTSEGSGDRHEMKERTTKLAAAVASPSLTSSTCIQQAQNKPISPKPVPESSGAASGSGNNDDSKKDVNEGASSLVSSTSGRRPRGPPRQIANAVLIPPFETITFKLDAANFEVVIVDDSALEYGYIGCIELANMAKLGKVQEYLKAYKDTGEAYKPVLNEYCLAKFMGEWYRAKVVMVDGDKYLVTYIDFTNEQTVNSEDIRRYPNDLCFDCYANLCLLNGLPDSMNKTQIEFLKESVQPHTKLTIDKVVKLDDGVPVIDVLAINRGLIDKDMPKPN